MLTIPHKERVRKRKREHGRTETPPLTHKLRIFFLILGGGALAVYAASQSGVDI